MCCWVPQAKEGALSAAPSVAMVTSAMDLFRQAAEQYSAVSGSEGKHEEVLAMMHIFLQSERVQHILTQPEPSSPAAAVAAASAATEVSKNITASEATAAPPPPPMTTSASDEAAVGFTAPATATPHGSTNFLIDDEVTSPEGASTKVGAYRRLLETFTQ